MTDGLIALDRHNIDRIALALESIAASLEQIAKAPRTSLTPEEVEDLVESYDTGPQLSDEEAGLCLELDPYFGPIKDQIEEGQQLYGLDRGTAPASLHIPAHTFELIPPRVWPEILGVYAQWIGGMTPLVSQDGEGGRILRPR